MKYAVIVFLVISGGHIVVGLLTVPPPQPSVTKLSPQVAEVPDTDIAASRHSSPLIATSPTRIADSGSQVEKVQWLALGTKCLSCEGTGM